MICENCKTQEVTSTRPEETLCYGCHWRQRNKPLWAKREIEESGMSPREFPAKWDQIPPEISAQFVTGGFGLTGETGTGKTYAMAAAIKRLVWLAADTVHGMDSPFLPARLPLIWVDWPVLASTLRTQGMSDTTNDEVEALCNATLLVLDDLGAERIKGAYSEDWTTSLLDRVVDTRYKQIRPTFWTSNLTPESLIKVYGARLVSRVIGLGPAIKMPTRKDYRIFGVNG